MVFEPIVLFCQIDSLKSEQFINNLSIDPDSYSLVLSKIGSKWNNKVGGEYYINVLNNQKFKVGASIGGFVNIHDFNENQILSWQLWRGSLGISTFFELHNVNWLTKSGRFITELSWMHESQHATDVYGYTYQFTNIDPENFSNGSIRTFEYYKLKANYFCHLPNDKWQLILSLGYKYFPNPQGFNIQRILLNSSLLETGIERKVFKRGFLYSMFYYENIHNNFVAQEQNYKGNWNKEPFIYRIFENGIGYINCKDKMINMFFYYSKSNGRGLDFIEVSESTGLGLRIVL
jgi:hypothetical protein